MAELALLAVTLAWGVSFTVAKEALTVLPPFALVGLRFLLGFLVLALVHPPLLRPELRTLRVGLALGSCVWLAFALQTVGLVFTTPAKSAFLTGCAVLLVPPLERLLLGRPVPTAVGVGVLTATAGLLLLLHPGSLADLNRGDLLTLGAAGAFALHIVLLGRYAPGHSSRSLAAYQILCVSLLATPVAIVAERPSLVLPAGAWLGIAFLGLVCTALAIQVQTWAQQRTPPTRAALIFALEPVSAALVSVLIYGERLAPGEWAGGLLVVLGVLAGSLSRAQALARPEE